MPKMLMTARDMVRGAVKYSYASGLYDLVVYAQHDPFEVCVIACDAFGKVVPGAVIRRHGTLPSAGDRIVIAHSSTVYTLPPLPFMDTKR